MSEQQLIHISNAVSGTFRLALDGAATASIPHNAAASRVASALTALPNVAGPVEVVKEQAASAMASSTSWRVAFVSNVGDLPLLTVQVRGLNVLLRVKIASGRVGGGGVLECVEANAHKIDIGEVQSRG